ncbi:predicted protein [Streptomyces sp. AA4]|nr:predicted protein [Streptomyces sp. AA4]
MPWGIGPEAGCLGCDQGGFRIPTAFWGAESVLEAAEPFDQTGQFVGVVAVRRRLSQVRNCERVVRESGAGFAIHARDGIACDTLATM